MATGGMSLSKEFFELLKAIGESKSKQEEDRIIMKEVQRLKSKMETPASTNPGSPAPMNSLLSSKKKAKEFLVRLLYVEMLGHDASWGLIKAVEMAASASLFHKRTGYLVCGACLPPTHEFRFMLVNQMQRDLQSPNVLECSGGLLAATNLIGADMVPAVSTEVTKLLCHDSATIRKKAIICLHRLHQLDSSVVNPQDMQTQLRKVLCDRDPSVMGSSLNVIHCMARYQPKPFKDLVPSLVSILKQIGEGRLPSDYDYHRVPAPWMQLQLVRILAILGQADANASSGMYEILLDTLRKADTGINAGYAIQYECIKTIVTIYPNPTLLDAAAETISRFIQSRSNNLKYLGVTGLAMIVETHPQYAAQHQIAVMDCLEDPDETLQRKTLDLLYRMTNPVNVEFISDKLLDFLEGTTDVFLKRVLTQRVCSVAERYAPNNAWYIQTITKLFEVSGDMVPQDVAQNLMSLIAEGTGEGDESADMLLRQNAVEIYVQLLREKPVGSLPRILLETMAWCLGEYGYLSAESSLDQIMQQMCTLALVHKAKLASSTRKFLVSAVMKLVAQAGTCPPCAAQVIQDYTRSKDCDLQQRCLEFQNLLTHCPTLLPHILPVDASAEDVEVDENLSFLDGYVQQSLANGARPYEKNTDDDDDDDEYDVAGRNVNIPTSSSFKMTPYEKPQAPSQAMLAMSGIGSAGRTNPLGIVSLPPGSQPPTTLSSPSAAGANSQQQQQQQPPGGLMLNTRNVANKWGKGGMTTAQPPAPPPPVANPAAGPASSSWETTSSGATGTGTSGYGFGSGASSSGGATAPPEPVVKTAEQLEKERMAAALFGGIVPGAAPPPPSSATTTMASRMAAAKAHAPPSAAAPTAPAPEIDLLDLGGWGDTGASAGATSEAVEAAMPPTSLVHLVPEAAPVSAPLPVHAAGAGAAGPIVETVSTDDYDDEAASAVSAPTPATASVPAAAAAPPSDDDPFASVLGDMQEKPLTTSFGSGMMMGMMGNANRFEYHGSPMAPMPISTAQFGQQWGSCPAIAPVSVTSSKITTLDQFMNLCADVGAHKVEAITATSEGICAGMLAGGTQIVLIHGKVTPTAAAAARLDITVKSTDQSLSGSLAMYLQTLTR